MTAFGALLAACGSPAPKVTPEQLDASVQPANCAFDAMLGELDGIPTVGGNQGARICEALTRRMGSPPQLRVLRALSKAASILVGKGSIDDEPVVAQTIDEVSEARGQTDPAAIIATYDLVVRTYQATDGRVTPAALLAFLKSSGPMAKTLSDDGIANMVGVLDRGR